MAKGYWRRWRYTINFPDGHRLNASSVAQVKRLATSGCTIDTDGKSDVPLERFLQEQAKPVELQDMVDCPACLDGLCQRY